MRRPLLFVILGLLVVCGGLGFVADRIARARQSSDQRAAALSLAGKLDGAERMYWAMLTEGPVTVPVLVAFLDAHERAVTAAITPPDDDDLNGAASPTRAFQAVGPPAVDEAAIDALLDRPELPKDIALLGRYWRAYTRGSPGEDLDHAVTAIADAEPPAPWANHLLAEVALHHARLDEAAVRFLREGSRFPERRHDVDAAMQILIDLEAWERIESLLVDPRVADAVQPWIQLRAAVRAHDWRRALRAFPRSLRPNVTLGTLALAGISALAWGTFCARLGHAGARPRFRVPVYLAAFVLGAASVSMTLAFVALEEGLLAMNETGNPLRDALFFVFGVGLREEVSKLVFFAALLPVLRRAKATPLDFLVCGALVGLGFAAEENLDYLRAGDLSTGMARFLTANFLHMSMTAILAAALDHMSRDDEGSLGFSRTLLIVAAMHGAYDFCLSSHTYGNLSWLAMALFFLLARQFLGAVSVARAQERASDPRLLETFAIGMAVVVGSSFVYASALVGPRAAAQALGAGLLGLGIVMILFVQELRRV